MGSVEREHKVPKTVAAVVAIAASISLLRVSPPLRAQAKDRIVLARLAHVSLNAHCPLHGRDDRRAAAAERVVHALAGHRVVDDRNFEQLDRFLRAMPANDIIGRARAAERVQVRDLPHGGLLFGRHYLLTCFFRLSAQYFFIL